MPWIDIVENSLGLNADDTDHWQGMRKRAASKQDRRTSSICIARLIPTLIRHQGAQHPCQIKIKSKIYLSTQITQ